MILIILSIHILLAIILFFIINWIGKHSLSIGYIQLTIFDQTEDNPAFNFLIRVLCPQVYLIIVATLLYALEQDEIVKDIFLVSLYYIIFRFIVSVLLGRTLLLNWYKQVFYSIAIVGLSYILYTHVIQYRKNILPDFSSLANELWIIILIFVYQLINNMDLTSSKAVQRRDNYIKKRYVSLKKKYSWLIHEVTQNHAIDQLAYAILIYEDFNRPRIVRWIEYISMYLDRKPRTIGIMQYRSDSYITDKESVRLGTQKLANKYKDLKQSTTWSTFENDSQIMNEIISDYNGGERYFNEISDILLSIQKMFYGGSTAKFLSNP